MLVWQKLMPEPPKKAPPPAAQKAAEAPKPAAPSGPAAPGPAAAPAAPAVPESAPEEKVTLKGNGFVATFTSHGGALASFVLEGEKFRRDENGKPVQIDLVSVHGDQARPFSTVASPELGGAQDVLADPFAHAPMRVVSRAADAVAFEGRVGTVDVKKTFRLTGKPYELAVELAVSGAKAAGTVSLLFPGYTPPSASKG